MIKTKIINTTVGVDKLLDEVIDGFECYYSLVLDNEHEYKQHHYSTQKPLYLYVYSFEQDVHYFVDLNEETHLLNYIQLGLSHSTLIGYVRNWRYLFANVNSKTDISQLIDVQNLHFYYTNENMLYYDCYRSIFKTVDEYSQHLKQNVFNVKQITSITDYKKYIPTPLLFQLEVNLFNYFKNELSIFTKMIVTEEAIEFNKHLNMLHTTELDGVNVNGELLYQDYNFFTATSRPSNSYKMNFNAMSKTSGIRDKVTSRYHNGHIVEFDYHASHLQILMDIVDYKFPEGVEDLYVYLGAELGISDLDRNEIKEKVFGIMYNEDEFGKYDHIEYFRKVHEFGNSLRQDSSNIKTKLFKRQIQVFKREDKPEEYYANRTSHKVHKKHHFGAFLNYYIQAHETERNLHTIKTVLEYIKNNKLKMKLILYVYDSLAFDIPDDEMNHLGKLQELISVQGKFQISSNSGTSYGQMAKIETTYIRDEV